MRGTIKDVARLAGVSVQTVSNVVNNRPVVRPETVERVLAAARELNYTPNAAARGLATGTRNVIGVVVPHLGNPRYGETLAVLNRSLRRQGFAALIGDTGWDEEAELHMVRTLVGTTAMTLSGDSSFVGRGSGGAGDIGRALDIVERLWLAALWAE